MIPPARIFRQRKTSGVGAWAAADNVVATQNYLTHPNARPKAKALSGTEMYLHGEALAWMTRATLLLKLARALPRPGLRPESALQWIVPSGPTSGSSTQRRRPSRRMPSNTPAT